MKYVLFITLFISGCTGSSMSVKQNSYLDLTKFFSSEITKLEKLEPYVRKTVSRNGLQETKSLNNINWKSELSLFIESDINKSAWKNSYKITSNKNEVTYTALDSGLRTKRILITRSPEGMVEKVLIVNKISNMLYESTEELLYITDSIYTISKKQHVVLVGDNDYKITGVF